MPMGSIGLLCATRLLIPLALILPHFMGVAGVYAAEAISDATEMCIRDRLIGIGSKFGDTVCAVRCLREKSSGYFIVRKVWVRIH